MNEYRQKMYLDKGDIDKSHNTSILGKRQKGGDLKGGMMDLSKRIKKGDVTDQSQNSDQTNKTGQSEEKKEEKKNFIKS